MNDDKVVFIFGSNKEEAGIHDGDIMKIGNVKEEDYFHSSLLLNFAHQYYPNISVFNKLSSSHRPEAISFFFTHFFNHAVFLNTTRYNENGSLRKYGKQGVLLLPQQLTDNQKDTLTQFLEEISDFNIVILYNLTLEQGFFDAEEIATASKERPDVLFEKYLEKTEKSKSL